MTLRATCPEELRRLALGSRFASLSLMPAPTALAASEGSPFAERMRRILVIDDDDARRGMLVRLFTFEGYEVDSLPGASEVLTHIAQRPPDLILLDVLMPGIGGLEVCGEIRMMDHLRLTPIILISAAIGDEESVVRGLLAGADDYFVTPNRLSELRARVRVQLRNRRDRELLEAARAQRDDYRNAALTDALTGLPNRRAADLALASAILSGEPLVLLLLDVDHFKRVNDTHGHAQGDVVLRELGRTLRNTARSKDEVARFGGEEFIVIARGAPSSAAQLVGERYRQAVAGLRFPDGCPIPSVTISVGAAAYDGTRGCVSGAEIVGRADAALYEAKRSGRNRVVVAVDGGSP